VDYVENFLQALADYPDVGLISCYTPMRKRGFYTPQHNKISEDMECHYLDFQNCIISKKALDTFNFNDSEIYFHGGLDFDFNLHCQQEGLRLLLRSNLKAVHEGGISPKHLKFLHKHIKKLKKYHQNELPFVAAVKNWQDFGTLNSSLFLEGWSLRYPKILKDLRKKFPKQIVENELSTIYNL
jgi:GT2 family glycosyltransferase